jgi:hypothetical protein
MPKYISLRTAIECNDSLTGSLKNGGVSIDCFFRCVLHIAELSADTGKRCFCPGFSRQCPIKGRLELVFRCVGQLLIIFPVAALLPLPRMQMRDPTPPLFFTSTPGMAFKT